MKYEIMYMKTRGWVVWQVKGNDSNAVKALKTKEGAVKWVLKHGELLKVWDE